jgi:hypothetical protein
MVGAALDQIERQIRQRDAGAKCWGTGRESGGVQQ